MRSAWPLCRYNGTAWYEISPYRLAETRSSRADKGRDKRERYAWILGRRRNRGETGPDRSDLIDLMREMTIDTRSLCLSRVDERTMISKGSREWSEPPASEDWAGCLVIGSTSANIAAPQVFEIQPCQITHIEATGPASRAPGTSHWRREIITGPADAECRIGLLQGVICRVIRGVRW